MVGPCVVPGCNGRKNGIFRFPCNLRTGFNCLDQMGRYSEWINAIGIEELRYVPSSEVHKSYRICGKHFRKDMITHVNGKSYLLPSAVPCLHLPAAPQPTETPQTKVINQPVQCESISSSNTITNNEDSAKLCTVDLDLDEYNLESSIQEYKKPRRVENDHTSTDQHEPQEDFNDNNNNDGDDDDNDEICVVLVTFDFINQLNQHKNDIDVDKDDMEKYDQIIKKKSIKLVKQIQINNEQNSEIEY